MRRWVFLAFLVLLLASVVVTSAYAQDDGDGGDDGEGGQLAASEPSGDDGETLGGEGSEDSGSSADPPPEADEQATEAATQAAEEEPTETEATDEATAEGPEADSQAEALSDDDDGGLVVMALEEDPTEEPTLVVVVTFPPTLTPTPTMVPMVAGASLSSPGVVGGWFRVVVFAWFAVVYLFVRMFDGRQFTLLYTAFFTLAAVSSGSVQAAAVVFALWAVTLIAMYVVRSITDVFGV